MNEFERAKQRIIERKELVRQQRLAWEEVQKKAEEAKNQKEAERKASLQRLEERRNSLPQVQKQALDFLEEINIEMFASKGKIHTWEKVFDAHEDIEYKIISDEGGGYTKSFKVAHKSEQLVAKLDLGEQQQALYFSIPLGSYRKKHEKVPRKGRWGLFCTGETKETWESEMSIDEEMRYVALGGQKCGKKICRIPHNYFVDGDQREKYLPIFCEIPLEDNEWSKFRRMVISYIGENF